MARAIWGGRGNVGDRAHFYIERGVARGQLVGRPYVRSRVRAYLRYGRLFSTVQIDETLRRTIDDDAWLARLNGCVVSAVCRAALTVAFDVKLDLEE